MDKATLYAISGVGSGSSAAIALLALTLQRSGVLPKGAYEANLQSTIEDHAHAQDRSDYLVLRSVLNHLTADEGDGPPTKDRIRLRVIQGGKTD